MNLYLRMLHFKIYTHFRVHLRVRIRFVSIFVLYRSLLQSLGKKKIIITKFRSKKIFELREHLPFLINVLKLSNLLNNMNISLKLL